MKIESYNEAEQLMKRLESVKVARDYHINKLSELDATFSDFSPEIEKCIADIKEKYSLYETEIMNRFDKV